MEEIYYILGIFAITAIGLYAYLSIQIKRLDMKFNTCMTDARNFEVVTGKCVDMVSSLSAKVQELDKELDTAREAMTEWSEAGKIARKTEQDFNDGLNNILNFQPGVTKKGDGN